MPGLLIAAPSSGAGKTTVTLGLLRALRRAGARVASAKAGPDYIDPAFHAAASGAACVNLDPWAMRPALLAALAAEAIAPTDDAMLGAEGLVVEAMMGLFDGAADGTGSSADLAARLRLNVVLVVDCAKQSQSVAALVRGFCDHRPEVRLAGVILNRVGSARHENMLRAALSPLGLPVLGVLPADAALRLPERHLGLVQAGEHVDLDGFLERAADWVTAGVDMAAVRRMAAVEGHVDNATMASDAKPPSAPLFERGAGTPVSRLAPLGQRIVVARDTAFAFTYPHLLDGWRRQGAELSFFSPLADEAPDPLADAVYLPGGYPELHAGVLAGASRFKLGMRAAADRGALVYGECGGYMVLGETLVDAGGTAHAMLGLLPLATSFAARRRHLGYRRVTMDFPWEGAMTAHEFHYASILTEGPAAPLLRAQDAAGTDLGAMGLRVGRVGGSFLHVIDRA